METYLAPCLLALVLAATFLRVTAALAGRVSLIRRETGRRHKPLPRFGGIALVAALIVAVLANPDLEMSPQLLGLLTGALLILVFGTWDDVVPLTWPVQIAVQLLLAGVIFAFGMRVWVLTNPFGDPVFLHPETTVLPSLLVGAVWTVLVMNVTNWIDGVDGLLGGVSAVAFVALLAVSLRPDVNQPAVAILSAIGVGLSVGLLVFNFPPARILAGTSGAYLIGFLIAALSVFAGAKIATALVVLIVPVLDAVFVVVERIRSGGSPFRGGDERHLHDRLRILGWSDRRIAIVYTGISAVAATAALALSALGKVLIVITVAFAAAFVLARIRRHIFTLP